MRRTHLRLILAGYVLVVIGGILAGQETEVVIPAPVLDAQKEAMCIHLHNVPLAASAVSVLLVGELVALVGLFLCWNPARFVFALVVLGKALLNPVVAPWFVLTGAFRVFGELELLMDGAIAVLVLWGPARPLFLRQAVAQPEPAGRPAPAGPLSRARLVAGVALVAAFPLARSVLQFLQGYFVVPYGWTMITALPLATLGSILAAAFAPVVLIPVRGPHRIAVGVVLWAVIFVLCIWPAGAVLYSRGFESALKSRGNLDGLQAWARQALEKHEAGQLKTEGEAMYWSAGTLRIAESELPEFLKSGMYKRTEHFWGPEFAIQTGDSGFDGTGTCVAVSWYLHGVLIGKEDYTTDWNPWYRRRLAPGIYSYHGMK